MQLIPVGPDALLLEVDDVGAALALALWCQEHLEAREVVPGARTVLLDGVADPAATAEVLAGWRAGPAPPTGALVEVPTDYDGADLGEVAALWDCTTAEVIERHAATEFRVSFCGFAPGFAYLAGLPEEWAVARLAEPRSRVPAGSVSLADSWCGIYPTESPGGWRLLGRTSLSLWDVRREPPALLPPGTRVRFIPR